MAEESNKELEDWVNMFCDFDSFCDEETKRLEESGLMYGIIYDNDFSDYALSYSRASFELKKEDLKGYNLFFSQTSATIWHSLRVVLQKNSIIYVRQR